MLNDKCPCYNCSERTLGCHNGCDKYVRWKADLGIVKVKMREEIGLCNRVLERQILSHIPNVLHTNKNWNKAQKNRANIKAGSKQKQATPPLYI